ncbi:13399_t:CDS:1 [Racocetra fulgida]|uniref:13399_t:CDS:1 n=1 Tax=Racocetra fulgida TaxID=60492 RepID=A0A9N8VK58_9GLOM|nr:13399_t:CDS:1 [Racocetra fulgida]
MSTAKNHAIWQYFTKNHDGSLSCLQCSNKYKKVPAVTTLKNHFIQKHNNIWRQIRSKSKGGGHKKKYKRQKHRDSSFKPPKTFKAIKTSNQNSEMDVDSENQCISEGANSKENSDLQVIEIEDEEAIQANLQNLVIEDNEINENSQNDNLNRDSANKIEIDATEAIAEFDAGNLKRVQGKFKISLN